MKKIYVQADTNDGDYITTFQDITEDELKKLMPIINILIKHRSYKKDVYPHLNECCKWNTRDMDGESVEEEYEGELTDAQIELMNEYIPCGEYGVHTIVSIEILEIVKVDNLLSGD